MTGKVLHKHVDTGLLVLRVGIGIMFLLHGAPKLFGGPSKWTGLGGAMGNLGITFLPAFWGFMAGFAEFGGGLLLILGLFVRPSAILMLFTMFVAATQHIAGGDGIMGASHAIELGIVFIALLITGPGKYSLDTGIGLLDK